MDENLKNDEKNIMLVKEVDSGKVKAITNVDEKGNAKTVEPAEANLSNLFNVNTNESFIEAFFRKMMEQMENPSHTGVYKVTKEVLDSLVKMEFPVDELEKYRINPTQELQTIESLKASETGETAQTFQPMDVSKIDTADLARKGIRLEDLEPHLKAMSFGHKSTQLVDMSPELEPGGLRVPTKGRVSLEEQPDGSLKVIPHYRQEKPNLDIPHHGVLLDDTVKANLLSNGHAGKLIDMELTPGKKEACFVTLDKLTNALEVMPVSGIPHMSRIKGVELSEGQQLDLYNGRKTLLEGFTTRAGYKRDAYIQIDASNKNISFTFDGLDKNRYAEENKLIRKEKMSESNNQKQSTAGQKQKEMFIPKRLLGVDVPEKAQKEWTEALKDPSKRAGLQAVYIKGMVRDCKGEPQNLWVRPNFEEGKFDFFKYNPKYAIKKGADVKPAVESEKQHAVNTQGKTDEATKHLNEPLKKGQLQPTAEQIQKQQQSVPKSVQKRSSPKL